VSTVQTIFESAALFEGLGPQELSQVFALTAQTALEANQQIFRESTHGDALFLLLSGRVDIVVHVPSEGRTEPLAHVRKGEIFGEFALIDRSPRSATAITRSPVALLQINRDDLLELCDDNHRIGFILMRNMATLLCAKLRETNLQWRNVIMYK